MRDILFFIILQVFIFFGIAAQKEMNSAFHTKVSDEAVEKITINLNDSKISDAKKNELKEWVRKHPNEFITIITSDSTILSESSIEKQALLYNLLTVAYYNIGQVAKAAEFNQMELDTYPLFSYNLTDSLQAYSNKTILFYSLNEPYNAMEVAINLHERLSKFSLNDDIVVLYHQLATIYGLVQLEEESEEVLQYVIEKSTEKKISPEHLAPIYLTMAYKKNREGDENQAFYFLDKVKGVLPFNQQLERRYLAGLAIAYQQKGDNQKAKDLYKRAFEAFVEYPDVISVARLFKDYMIFLRTSGLHINVDFIQDGLAYIKSFSNVDNQEYLLNCWKIELNLRYFLGKIDQSTVELSFKVDSLQGELNQKYLYFLKSNRDYHFQEQIHRISLDQLRLEKKNASNRLVLLYYISGLLLSSMIFLFLFLRNQKKLVQAKFKLQEKEAAIAKKEVERANQARQKVEMERNFEKQKAEQLSLQADKQKALLSRLDAVVQEVKKVKDLGEGIRILQSFNNEFKQFLNGVFEQEMLVDFKMNQSKKYNKLKEILGTDESSEFFLAVLFIQGFSTKEASLSLGKSEKAVRSMRYRLRKQLNIDTDTDLEQYLQSIDQ